MEIERREGMEGGGVESREQCHENAHTPSHTHVHGDDTKESS